VYTTNNEKKEETCFIDINVWGRQAESVSKYLQKGSSAFIEGRLQLDQWEDRETGKARSRMRVVADRVQFLNSPRSNTEFAPGGTYQQNPGYAPQQQRQQYQQPQYAPQQPPPQMPPPAFAPDAQNQQNAFANAPAAPPPFVNAPASEPPQQQEAAAPQAPVQENVNNPFGPDTEDDIPF
jgi:single-strand DNA-binding protein